MATPTVTLRCTRKLLDRLGLATRVGVLSDERHDPAAPPSVLGDWYATVLVVARRPLVLCVAERSLLAIVLPLREARTVVVRWQGEVARRLLALGVADERVAHELAWVTRAPVVPVMYERAVDTTSASVHPATHAPRRPIRTGTRLAGSTPARHEPDVGRRMIGVLNDMAWICDGEPLRLDASGALVPDVAAMEAALDRLPCGPLGSACPADATRALFGVVVDGRAREDQDGRGPRESAPGRGPDVPRPVLRLVR